MSFYFIIKRKKRLLPNSSHGRDIIRITSKLKQYLKSWEPRKSIKLQGTRKTANNTQTRKLRQRK